MPPHHVDLLEHQTSHPPLRREIAMAGPQDYERSTAREELPRHRALERAGASGWTLISIKDDWENVF